MADWLEGADLTMESRKTRRYYSPAKLDRQQHVFSNSETLLCDLTDTDVARILTTRGTCIVRYMLLPVCHKPVLLESRLNRRFLHSFELLGLSLLARLHIM